MVWKWVPVVTAVFYVLAIALCVSEYPRRKSRENGVYLPDLYFWVGLIGGGVFAGFGFLGAEGGSFAVAVFSCFSVLSSLLMLGWRNSYFVYDNEGFTQYNLIGMQRRFLYEQVTGWDTHPGNELEAAVYVLGKKVTFSWLSPRSADFVVALKRGYRRTHGGKNLPVQRTSKNSTGFSAHVRNPGEFLAVFIMLVVFIAGMGGWCIWMTMEPLDGSDCETLNLTFSAWSVEDSELILTAAGYEEKFEIRGYPEFVSIPNGILEHTDGEAVFTAQARRINPDTGPDYYWIQSLRIGETEYLTLEDATAQWQGNMSMTLWFFGGCLGIILALGWLTYRVGCNPSKYPKWLVNGLFKKGYIIY